MRIVIGISVLLLVSAMGCGKKNFTATKAQTASSAGSPPPNQSAQLTQLTGGELSGIAGVVGNLIAEILENLQGLNGGFQFTDGGVNANFGFYCQGGGSVALTAQAQTDADIGVGSVQAALLSGSGSLTFSLCRLTLPNGEQLNLDGALQLSQMTGALNANYSLGGSANFSVNSATRWAGNVHVSVGTLDQACAFNGQHSGSGSGAVNPAQNFMPSGTYSFQLQGQICGAAVANQFSASY